MKKILLLFTALLVVPVFSSELHVYNNTDYSLYYMIGASPSDGSFHPSLQSRGPFTASGDSNAWYVSLGPLENIMYFNPSGFPFDSQIPGPATAEIQYWVRALTAGSPSINTTNSLAQLMFGSTHRYRDFKFFVQDEFHNIITAGNIDPILLDQPLVTSGQGITTSYFPLEDNVFILFDYTP